IIASTNRTAVDTLCARDFARDPAVAATAARIVTDVRRRGDRALAHWMKQLDAVEPPFEITAAELRRGWSDTPRDVRAAIRVAARNIRRVARRQLPTAFVLQVGPGIQ